MWNTIQTLKTSFLHYRLYDNEEFITELMPNVLLGFHMKSFILFTMKSLNIMLQRNGTRRLMCLIGIDLG